MINENSAARETQRNLEAEILDSLRKADGNKILDDEVEFLFFSLYLITYIYRS